MARPTPLQAAEIDRKLDTLPGWSRREGKLHREFAFEDFAEAFAFMTRMALVAQAMNHHPEWSNVYNKVVVDLATHDAGGITELDLRLAGKMQEAADRKG